MRSTDTSTLHFYIHKDQLDPIDVHEDSCALRTLDQTYRLSASQAHTSLEFVSVNIAKLHRARGAINTACAALLTRFEVDDVIRGIALDTAARSIRARGRECC